MKIPNIIQQQFKKNLPPPGKTGVDWYLFCYFLEKYQSHPMLEVGVGNGGSLYTMLAYSDQVTVVDNWQQGWLKQTITENLDRFKLHTTFLDTDSHSLDSGALEKYAFVHLDAHKSLQGTVLDLQLASTVCHGIICVDDYMSSMWPEVTWGVDEFCNMSPAWKKIFIGNHQIFLAKNDVQIKELVVEFPVINRENTWYLTYGDLPDHVMPFVEFGKIQYSWHWYLWINKNKNLL